MRSHVSNAYRTEEVHLQPHGNTVTVTTLAENPFENEGEIEVVTQASGGMVGADPEMTSGVQHQRRRGMWGSRPERRPLGVAPSRRQIANAVDESVDGLGDAYSDAVVSSTNSPGAIAFQAAQPVPVPESKPFNWDALGKVTANIAAAGGSILSAQAGAKTAAAQAKAADAAARAEQSRTLQASLMSRMGTQVAANAKSNWPIILGGVAVVGLGIFLLMRKRGAPATNPRRR